ncbi:minichromosome maintenance 10 [Euphorbia peplus]|nr:minichromosome maintenance 10 [Euphorbia peplus]
MSSHEEDVDLLLSLQDRILETPPSSPSHSPARTTGQVQADLSVFRDAVQDCLHDNPTKPRNAKQSSNSSDAPVEKYSGFRIRNQLVTPVELSQRLSDIRFIRLPAIKNQLVGESIRGLWATVGILTEKGNTRTSSAGKSYSIWKFGCLDENTISVFLFNDAYQQNSKERAGAVFALFNCNVRKDKMGGFSLSAYSANQILKIGDSIDYGVCKGKKKDGMPCTLVINKRQGVYCKFHKSKASDIYSTMRTELKGGNIRRAFKEPVNSKGIYLVDPDRTATKKPTQPAKLLSVEALKKALRNGDKVTTNTHSQGIRFLNEMTGTRDPKKSDKISATPSLKNCSSEKRKACKMKVEEDEIRKKRECPGEQAKQGMEKMIVIDIFGSDEEEI